MSSALKAWALPDLAETTELLTCELVSNAVRHARCECRLRIRRGADATGHGVRVEVSDADPTLPQRTDNGPESSGGRGLLLVEALASAWGTERTAGGKVVWFEVSA